MSTENTTGEDDGDVQFLPYSTSEETTVETVPYYPDDDSHVQPLSDDYTTTDEANDDIVDL